MIERGSGILLHITSLPSPYGIGTFGKEAYEFVDFLEKAGQKYWQILPLGTTGYGDSPYQSFSSYAGNPYFIDFDLLVEDGLLNKEDFQYIDFGDDEGKVDYGKIFNNKMAVLRCAYKNAKKRIKDKILMFKENNVDWIEEYSLYMTAKTRFDLKSWQKWDKDIKQRKLEAIKYYKENYEDEINFWVYLQYEFFKQWKNLKKYANGRGIKIIGDIPIYVAEDSADVWANKQLFLLNDEYKPIKVAGCPPDAFSKTGQLWGNPIYDWNVMEEQGFEWWIKRIKANSKLYDITRIDHFRGFESYWEVPYGDETAINGRWVKGPGIKLFDAIKDALGDIDIIAEDLGFLTEEVINFRKKTGFPGMKVLQFAFDAREESDYLPHNYEKNCVVYTGTHDNDTVNGWFKNANPDDVEHAIRYLNLNKEEGYNWGFIRGAWSSVANIAIAQMQDFLGLGSEARMNTPSTLGGNWLWRVKKHELDYKLAERIYKMTKLYGR
ncbi:4-alpha-glucanotransferase [Paramaledivibacter caminithermalis]|jgi:4-alpha-glucanotransferase|uniref:4-alpha-glucanotransferase n=1 Tax=Paramaledivibacter caminithermalis (strain DSM 15212 / CIP 107654 / DViRD3) TaxID=1121301 RepID=A0A1M6LND2_PARC5|nr:4-alpha-glucanotransferase [Paramaledivibacter caminithermalis]SHJ72694.1 4-alpha-glucanotransferase [Paramaledivibacter caminithermalis DSM 15212]